ncbi:substrate-binding domain-containing protein [Nitriliruptoria bacterium AS10]|nr:substrate-binding domain-containing protein [Salsipaludibacter albus]
MSAIVPDDEVGGHDATALLTAAGHRRIGFINDDHDVPAATLRLEGYHRALAEVGLEPDPDLVVYTDDPITPVGGRTAVGRLLDLDKSSDGRVLLQRSHRQRGLPGHPGTRTDHPRRHLHRRVRRPGGPGRGDGSAPHDHGAARRGHGPMGGPAAAGPPGRNG